jgi:hypothetical protein
VLQLRPRGEPRAPVSPGPLDAPGLPDGLFATAWCACAWLLALLRLQRAVAHHEIFGVDATLAFLFAVVWPLTRAKAWLRTLRKLTSDHVH